MTLILKPDLDIVLVQVCTEKKVPGFKGAKSYNLKRYTDKQAARQTQMKLLKNKTCMRAT